MGWNARLIMIAVGLASVPMAEFVVDLLNEDENVVTRSRQARIRLLQEIRLRSALDEAPITESGWITEVSRNWFGSPPAPPWWFEHEFEWLEVASGAEALMKDPPNRMLRSSTDAVWWYNPTLGVLRARVPHQPDDLSSYELYARVNH